MVGGLFNAVLHAPTNNGVTTYLITSTESLNPQTNSTWLVEGTFQAGTNDATPFALGIGARTNQPLHPRSIL